MASSGLNVKQIILVPAVITLGVTLLRLVGELNRWSPMLFGREAGGGGSIVGIAWLVPIFGVYFALKLARMGHAPASGWKTAGVSLLAVAAAAAVIVVLFSISQSFTVQIASGVLAALTALFVIRKTWPALFRTLLAYGFAARIPVAIVMLFAIYGGWGTHYELGPPGMPEMSPFVKWIVIGLIPQMTAWIAYTVVFGSLFGGIAAALAGKGAKQASQAA
ncbi:MAG: hypothetical protein ACRD1X_18490 [Vicinamibacteria bacterium]